MDDELTQWVQEQAEQASDKDDFLRRINERRASLLGGATPSATPVGQGETSDESQTAHRINELAFEQVRRRWGS